MPKLPFRFNPAIERRHARLRRLKRKHSLPTLTKAQARQVGAAAIDPMANVLAAIDAEIRHQVDTERTLAKVEAKFAR